MDNIPVSFWEVLKTRNGVFTNLIDTERVIGLPPFADNYTKLV